MKKFTSNKAIIFTVLSALLITSVSGFSEVNLSPAAKEAPSVSETLVKKSNLGKAPKYIFMFIGDGLSFVQANAAQVCEGNNTKGEVAPDMLNFSQFPVAGVATTQDSTSFCPDSASTATSLSTGVKTHSGTIGMAVDKQTVVPTITELLKDQKNMKIGVVSNVTINHATPAAYYAHTASRNNYYDIALQMADSGFDYFGGGSINQATGKEKDQKSAYTILEEKGFMIADTKEEIEALNSESSPAYAVSPVLQDSGAMPYAIDTEEGDLQLADFVRKGIDVLDNKDGFFLMTESGKIDWACHANDAKATIGDVLAFEDAIQVAIDFAEAHPMETLIIVTGDHETGGMTIGYAATGYSTAFDILEEQEMSYVAFDSMIKEMKEEDADGLTFDDVMPAITENFGLFAPDASIDDNALEMTEGEYAKLQAAFAESMLAEDDRDESDEAYLMYGGYDPLSVTLTHILNNKAGVGWTSYSHTGVPVGVYAVGVGAYKFNGSYDNTDIFNKLAEVTQIKSGR
ncbi:alkaline phosphatase [Acidaminobacter hydrogenoformans]|uniref:Alkaline phosphatase n=1 Tax=Acidaminobacter hydrogenoformans DSM 2784 TaxID=1120920 RepID=A0A1G5S0G8_9FIRM|nr:alkaline phosphatase [Acidaminobacter hydrogenoformans]SCZ79895.1 alkaline phosphatase [Acidaminobacter hydrogenoformans DSM 2784]